MVINLAYIHYYLLMFLVLSVLIIDNKTFLIRDWIFYPVTFAALFINYHFSGKAGLYNSIFGTIFPVAVLIIFSLFGILDKADIKLFCAIGTVMGLNFIVFTIIYSILVQVIITFIIMRIRNNMKERLSYYLSHLKACWASRDILPYYGFDYEEKRSKMPFTFSIVCGLLIKILCC